MTEREVLLPAEAAQRLGVATRVVPSAASIGRWCDRRPGCAPIHDALAVCAVIDPTILTTEFIPVDVEVAAELSMGRTVCDFRSRPDTPANVHFATDADEAKFVAMLLYILGPAPRRWA
ncbi:MAG: hypothetical protein RJA49_466 [Actinomycetota bacterium]